MKSILCLLLLGAFVAVTSGLQPGGPLRPPRQGPLVGNARPFNSGSGFGPERQALPEDVEFLRRHVDEFARRISVVRQSKDRIVKMDLYSVRTVELPNSDRSYLMKILLNDNRADVWFVNFYFVGRQPEHSHVSGVDSRPHRLEEPLVEFPLQQNLPQAQPI